MNLLEIFIGLVQGLTEFLPVSSSGHIAVLEHWFGVFSPDLSREVSLHLATLLAVFVYFRRRIWELIVSWSRGRELGYLLYLVLGSIPAAAVGLTMGKIIEDAFSSLLAIGAFFFLTGLFLLSTRWAFNRGKKVGPVSSFLIGIAQAFAILPGISRSGATISAGLHLGVEPQEAFEFSFLLSIPAILGAGLLEVLKVNPSSMVSHWQGALAAFLTGYFALFALSRVVKKGKLWVFSPYLFILSIIILITGGLI